MPVDSILPASGTIGRQIPAHDRLDATEPITGYSLGDDAEPYCITCDASVGVFPTLGDSWRHYRGDGITAKAEPYDAGHPAVIGWRFAGDIPAR